MPHIPEIDLQPAFRSDDGRFTLYQGDCLEVLAKFPDNTFDMIFADPPYFLSNGGITCQAGRMVSVNKGKWDKTKGFEENYNFTIQWLSECKRVLNRNGSLWISGTNHIIHIIGFCLQKLEFKILNDITWVKSNPPPNLSCRYFTHATETVLWARKSEKSKHKFNYKLMKQINGGKQMTSVWRLDAPRKNEKLFGKHPTQKPVSLLERIILASTEEDDLVLDPFSGSSTTGIAAVRLGRNFIGIEKESEFIELSKSRFDSEVESANLELFDKVKGTRKARASK